jgi:phosphoribosylformylglycinamidine synthase
LADGVAGLTAAAQAIGLRPHPGAPLPFVSGNVSLYNESRAGGAIPPAPIVACLGVLADYSRTCGMRIERAGDRLVRLGGGGATLGASLYASVTEQMALFETDALPELDCDAERARAHVLLDAFAAGLVRSAHDLGDGGLLMALAEMSFGRAGRPELGIASTLPADSGAPAARLFSEASGYVAAVRPESVAAFETICRTHGVAAEWIGTVQPEPRLTVTLGPATVVDIDLVTLAAGWRAGLRAVLDEGSAE